jgi:4-hydroxybenzoate polyprenyltransferase/phosphoserine phosphatase
VTRPLVVDLDGTLLRSDLFVESFFALVAADPLAACRTTLSLREGRARTKTLLAEQIQPDWASLPWNVEFLAFLKAERTRGRAIYLASASAGRYVQAVADHLGLFDGIFASSESVNLKSHAKAAALVERFGARGFDYAGNETADLAVWEVSGRVVIVNATGKLQDKVRARWPDALVIGSADVSLNVVLRTGRAHQWLKNLLIFVPAAAAHQLSVGALLACLVGWVSFSLIASSVYILNDLIDLGRDRAHQTKRLRPLAAGQFPIMRALMLVPILLAAALGVALILGPGFCAVLIGYYALTMGYSLLLKRLMMIDVVTLACLYGIRLIAGGAAAHVALSDWLVAFSLFLFMSLALVKRCTELVGKRARGEIVMPGRAYETQDLPILESLAAASGFTAVLVFALYLNSATVIELYGASQRLWLICIVLIYWIGRMLLLTHRGQMHDDPVIFAVTDRASLACVALSALIVFASF